MGFFNNKKILKADGFQPLELNEGEIHAIFNRCLATNDTPKENIHIGILFSRTTGYKPEDEIAFSFDRKKLLANKQTITYLYGQLQSVHSNNAKISVDDAFYNYSGKKWTNHKAYVLELLYLGCNHETLLMTPFFANTNLAVIGSGSIKPTLSPKDPNFPKWWEQHKAEWEVSKQGIDTE